MCHYVHRKSPAINLDNSFVNESLILIQILKKTMVISYKVKIGIILFSLKLKTSLVKNDFQFDFHC